MASMSTALSHDQGAEDVTRGLGVSLALAPEPACTAVVRLVPKRPSGRRRPARERPSASGRDQDHQGVSYNQAWAVGRMARS
jgi:hypothetical protein